MKPLTSDIQGSTSVRRPQANLRLSASLYIPHLVAAKPARFPITTSIHKHHRQMRLIRFCNRHPTGQRGIMTTRNGHWKAIQALVHVIKLSHSRKEIRTLPELKQFVESHGSLFRTIIQSLDLSAETDYICSIATADSIFLGCRLQDKAVHHIQASGGLVFPDLSSFPYRAFRNSLYTPDELMAGYNSSVAGSFYKDTLDSRIYHHYDVRRKDPAPLPVLDLLAQRLHDTSMDHALEEFLRVDNRRLRAIGIMGGHGLKRTDDAFRLVARLAFALAKHGFVVITGGGPGAMEAGNMGAFLSLQESESCIDEAIKVLSPAPTFRDPGWFETAYCVRDMFPHGAESVGVPTWFYGHEPSNLFSTHVAKYFSNSLREDGLICVALAGIIFAPGSAGTVQEIFQDVCQNHYGSNKLVSPMVFLGAEFWTVTLPVYPLVKALSKDRAYDSLVCLCDSMEDAVHFIETHPPQLVDQKPTVIDPAAETEKIKRARVDTA